MTERRIILLTHVSSTDSWLMGVNIWLLVRAVGQYELPWRNGYFWLCVGFTCEQEPRFLAHG